MGSGEGQSEGLDWLRTFTDPLIPLGLREVGREPQFGHEGQSLPDRELRKKTVVLTDVGHALLHQLRCVWFPINQNLTRGHGAALVPTRDNVQQRRFSTT